MCGTSTIPVQRHREDPRIWFLPPPHMAKVSIDASWRQGESRGTVGVVIRDSSGRCLAVKRREVFASSVTAAEALAVLEGCLLARHENLNQVVMESDSLSIITWLRGSLSNATWEAFPVLTRVLDIAALMHSCIWSWIPRLGNEAADFVASHQVPKMRDLVWVNRPPSSFVRILNKDGLPCSPT